MSEIDIASYISMTEALGRNCSKRFHQTERRLGSAINYCSMSSAAKWLLGERKATISKATFLRTYTGALYCSIWSAIRQTLP